MDRQDEQMRANSVAAGAPPADDVAPELAAPELTVIVVSYNTREMTLTALRSLFAETRRTPFEVVVVDNASSDGSADAIAAAFPEVRLIRSLENLGFAAANNLAAEGVESEWLLLLNPDTEVRNGAVDRLVAFGRERPGNGVYGGRTVFPDGSLNIASCWNRITPWSAFCRATGLSALFRRSALFNPEALGGWRRDSVREVDIVVGCFMLIRTELWRRLGGFDPTFWMYGEEADLCLRARRLGCRPIITPEAEIMHVVGAASGGRSAAKLVKLARARSTLERRHWPWIWRPWGRAMDWFWAASRFHLSLLLALPAGERAVARKEAWREVWRTRRSWLGGY